MADPTEMSSEQILAEIGGDNVLTNDLSQQLEDLANNPEYAGIEAPLVPVDPENFYANLAESLTFEQEQQISKTLRDSIEADKKALQPFREKYDEGIRRTGLGNDAPGGADFQGATRTTHPLLAEAAIDFQARATKELLPPDGPVKIKMEREFTRERFKKARRVERFLNRQMTKTMSEYIPNMERLFSQTALIGDQYMKFMWDDRLRRPKSELVTSDDVLIPSFCTDFYSAERVTHVQNLTEVEFQSRISSGLYRQVEYHKAGDSVEETEVKNAQRKISGIEQDIENTDGVRKINEIDASQFSFSAFGLEDFDPLAKFDFCPYIVTIDETSDRICAIYRNWDPEDTQQTKLDWMVQFPFIPWDGPKAIGLYHIIGMLSAAQTGALRALLDSAHINNVPCAIKLKQVFAGKSMSGQNITLNPTGITEIDAGQGVDDIRKLIMPVPFNGPSEVLFKLLGYVDALARGVVRTTIEESGDGNENVPVGTTLARLEQAMVVYSSIHARMHRAQAKSLQVLCRINAQYMTEPQPVTGLEEDDLIHPDDFKNMDDITPVSDPQIFSDTQRITQHQGVMALAAATPQMFNMYNLNRRMLELMRIPNIDEIMPPPEDQKDEHPVAENVKMAMGQHAFALPDQDHLAHIQVHMTFMENPIAQNEVVKPLLLPNMAQHLMQHMVLYYASVMHDQVDQMTDGQLSYLMQGKFGEHPEVAKRVSQLMAMVSKPVNADVAQKLAPISELLNKLQAQAQQYMMPPPMDPSQAQIKIAQDTLQVERENNSGKLALQEKDLGRKAQQDSNVKQTNEEKAEIARIQIASKERQVQQTNETEIIKNVQDNNTAKEIAAEKLEQGEGTNLKTGDGFDPGRGV